MEFEAFKEKLVAFCPCSESKMAIIECNNYDEVLAVAKIYTKRYVNVKSVIKVYSQLKDIGYHHPVKEFFAEEVIQFIMEWNDNDRMVSQLEENLNLKDEEIEELNNEIGELEQYDIRGLLGDYNPNLFDPFNNFADREALLDFIRERQHPGANSYSLKLAV